MKKTRLKVGGIPAVIWGEPAERGYLYVHGQGGSKEEAEAFGEVACPRGWQVLSVDLPGHGERTGEAEAFDPWHAVPELRRALAFARERWRDTALYAGSIGAYFSLLAFAQEPLEQCLFVSPVVDMERLIRTMMGWVGVTEARLEREGTIPTDFGQTLSWAYWTYVRQNPIAHWAAPTEILYAGGDALVERQTVEAFAARFGCGLTVLEKGEHWFHTPEQLAFLRRWAEERVGE